MNVATIISNLPDEVVRYLSAVPEEARIRGMFFHWITMHLRGKGLDPKAFGAADHLFYRHYPLREYLAVLVRSSLAMYPNVSWGEAVRAHGPQIFRLWQGTGHGKTLLRGAATTRAVARVAPHTYPVLCKPGEIDIEMLDQGMRVRFSELWTLNSHLQLGLWQALCSETGSRVAIDVEELDLANTIFHIRFLEERREEPRFTTLVR